MRIIRAGRHWIITFSRRQDQNDSSNYLWSGAGWTKSRMSAMRFETAAAAKSFLAEQSVFLQSATSVI
jgi:hypothetical protein